MQLHSHAAHSHKIACKLPPFKASNANEWQLLSIRFLLVGPNANTPVADTGAEDDTVQQQHPAQASTKRAALPMVR
jgi:hypothetical protein